MFSRSALLVGIAAVSLYIAIPVQETVDARDDPLFSEYPAVGSATLSNGEKVSTPFHCRNATSYVLWGTASKQSVEPLLKDSTWEAVTLAADPSRVLAQFWVVKYFDTTAGPYEELIASFVVQPRSNPRPATVDCKNSFCHISHLFLREGTHCFLHKLWLNETLPILYGRDLLGANKFHADFGVGFLDDRSFDVNTPQKEELIVKGTLPESGGLLSQWFFQYPKLILGMGIRDAVTMLFSTVLRGTAVGPRGVISEGREGVFESVFRIAPFRKQNPSFASVDPTSLTFGPELSKWDLRLDTMTRFEGFRFVLQQPWA